MSDKTLYAPNLICICVNKAVKGDYSGLLWNQYQDEPREYHSSIELIKIMDNWYDEWKFPQCSTSCRQFRKKSEKDNIQTGKTGEELQMDARRIQKKKGDQETFIVRVKYRQNATWQGEVIWAEREEKEYFRSALELLKLIDSALDESTDEAEMLPEDDR